VEAGEFRIGGLLLVLELQKRISELAFPPSKVVGGAAGLIEEVAASKISCPAYFSIPLVELSPNRAFSRRWKPVNFGSAAFRAGLPAVEGGGRRGRSD
jgi:hypothetical protein